MPKPSFDACAIEFADGPSDSDDDLVVVARAPPAKENPIAAYVYYVEARVLHNYRRAAILGLLRKHVSQKKQRERENLDDYRRADEEDFTDDEGEEEEEEEEQEQLEARESSPSALHLSTEKQPMSPLRSPFASDDEDDTENRAADKDEQTEVGDMDRQSELLSDMAEESNDGESNDDEERDSEEADAHDADADVQRKERRIESDGSDTEDDDDETLHRTKKVIGPTGTLLRDDDSDVEEDQDFAAYHAEIAALLEEPEERPSTPPAKKASSQPRVADVDAVREDGLHVDDAVDEVEHSDVEYDVDRENSDDEAEGGFLDMEAEDVDAHGDGEDEEEGDDDYRNLDYVVSDHKMQEEKPDLHARILRDMQNDDDDEVLQRVSAIAAGMARQKRGAVEISDDEDEDAIQRIRRRRAEKTRAQQAIGNGGLSATCHADPLLQNRWSEERSGSQLFLWMTVQTTRSSSQTLVLRYNGIFPLVIVSNWHLCQRKSSPWTLSPAFFLQTMLVNPSSISCGAQVPSQQPYKHAISFERTVS